MPSQTTSSVSSPALLRQTTTASSFSSRSRPGSVAHAIRSRISDPTPPAPADGGRPLRADKREVHRVLADRDAVAVAELFLLDRLTVDQGSVGASQVDDPELVP